MELDFKDALVVTGGGTGGHYYPALALAEGARKRWPDRPIIFIGASDGMESRKLPATALPYLLLGVRPLQGGLLDKLRAAWRMFSCIRRLKKIWRKQRPWAVLGTGGYASGPSLFAARALKIPYYIHESNAEPGLIAKLAAKRAIHVWLGMEAAAERLSRARCLHVGTPVRSAFLRPFKPYSDLSPPHTLLVLGGSGGARAINDAMLSIGPTLLEKNQDWVILHQTGMADMGRLEAHPRQQGHTLVPYIEDMDAAIENASLVLSRAGAGTCSELKTVGRPAVLVPFPHAAGDHQKHNALTFQKEGRGIVVEQGPGFEDRLFVTLLGLMENRGEREKLSKPETNGTVSRCLDDISGSETL